MGLGGKIAMCIIKNYQNQEIACGHRAMYQIVYTLWRVIHNFLVRTRTAEPGQSAIKAPC